MSDVNRIQVAVGIVFNVDGQVLVGQRVVKDRYFAKWEFPGGKVEAGESIADALHREFLEEVGITLGISQPFMEIKHDYPDRSVQLYVRTVNTFSGEVKALEGQALKWVHISELRELDFLQGNQAMIEKLESEYSALNEC